MYTPTKQIEKCLRVQYPTVKCQKCGAALNPYCPVDYTQKFYTCVFCGMQQQLPAAYREITEQRKPAELHFQYRTMEYELQQVAAEQRLMIFCIDTCVSEEELAMQKQALQTAIDMLPDSLKVVLLTFGTVVNVHELQFEYCPRRVVFRGSQDVTPAQVEQFLNLKSATQKFALPLEQCRDTLTQLVEDLQLDMWTVPEKHRPYRGTGVCLSLAFSIAHSLQAPLVSQRKNPFGNVVLFTGGPCTTGPGQVVDTDLSQHVRHWPDIQQKNEVAKYVKDTTRFYEKLSERALESGCALNVFSCATDQVGLYELQQITEVTGGTMMISESFSYQAFTRSWRLFLEMRSEVEDSQIRAQGAVQIQVSCSDKLKIHGALGPVVSLRQNQSGLASSVEIGAGSTDRWGACGFDSDVSVAFIFDQQEVPRESGLSNRFVQFRTEYTDAATGRRYLRVTTCGFLSDYNESVGKLCSGFDQEAAAAVIGRLALHRFRQTLSTEETLRGVDRIIIRAAKAFSTFVPNDENSVRFAANFEFFPQFLYHFRRSELVQLFGQSPDETAMKHAQMARQTVSNILSMMQPALLAYTVQDPAGAPVFLDSQECEKDRILLMDSFFNLLVWSGSTVAAWRAAGYHTRPEYAHVKALIDAPEPECEEILAARFPNPRFDHADQGTSQARILLARVNPAATHKTGAAQGEVVATDDVPLQQFVQVLKKAVSLVEK